MKSLNRATLLTLFVALAAPVSVHAQDTTIVEDDRVVFQKKTVIDFSDVDITGELTKPEGQYVKNRKKTRFRSLIELRGNFRPELHRSVSAL